MLTIGQLAGYVGVTVRAVRHYHQRGLLAEPARDASGYRRYGAQAVLDLVRIKILSDAGVPLTRIEEVLDAQPEQFAQAIAAIDEALQRQILELQRRRLRIAELAGGEHLFLPADLVGFLEELRALGISPRTVQIERDGWILLMAGDPERATEMLAQKRANLTDPEFVRLYRTYDEAADWDPDDSRLEELADAMVLYVEQRFPSQDHDHANSNIDDATILALLTSHSNEVSSPSSERLDELAEQKLARQRRQQPPPPTSTARDKGA